MYFQKELELDEGGKVQKREEKCIRTCSWKVLLSKVFLKGAGAG